MKLELSRRDLLLSGAGAAAGIALSPVPWKLLDDLSIWTQQPNTKAPRPAGPLAFRHTSCALCPVACGLKARCFGAQPVSFAPVAGHPASDGGLCPLGLTAHHLAKHPLRTAGPERVSNGRRERIDRAAAVAALAAALGSCTRDGKRSFAVVDGRPGRSLSRAFRALAAATGGHYVTPPATGIARSLEALSTRGEGAPALGFDAAKARRVLSFGAPVLTDAGVPGRLARLRADSRRGPRDARIEVIHAGAMRTKSAALADRFVPIAPGTEAALALGLAHVLLDEKLADAAFLAARTTGLPELEALAARFAPELVAQKTGLPAGEVVDLARDLAAHRPAVVLGGDALAPLPDEAEAAIAALNLLLGAPGGALHGGSLGEARPALPPSGPSVPSITHQSDTPGPSAHPPYGASHMDLAQQQPGAPQPGAERAVPAPPPLRDSYVEALVGALGIDYEQYIRIPHSAYGSAVAASEAFARARRTNALLDDALAMRDDEARSALMQQKAFMQMRLDPEDNWAFDSACKEVEDNLPVLLMLPGAPYEQVLQTLIASLEQSNGEGALSPQDAALYASAVNLRDCLVTGHRSTEQGWRSIEQALNARARGVHSNFHGADGRHLNS